MGLQCPCQTPTNADAEHNVDLRYDWTNAAAVNRHEPTKDSRKCPEIRTVLTPNLRIHPVGMYGISTHSGIRTRQDVDAHYDWIDSNTVASKLGQMITIFPLVDTACTHTSHTFRPHTAHVQTAGTHVEIISHACI